MKIVLSLLLLFLSNLALTQETFEIKINGDAIVDNEITIEVDAINSEPIKAVWLVIDNDYTNTIKLECNGDLNCQLTTTFTLPYEGTVKFRAFLWVFPNTAIKEVSTQVNFVCGEEYCEPDPVVNKFITWMRNSGYKECVTEKYYTFLKDPNLRAHMKGFINSDQKLNRTMNLNFYDIIPTDINAVYYEMNTENAELCQYSSNWPNFCQNPEPADYKMVEKHFRQTFGVDLNLTYTRVEINYREEFGELSYNSSIGGWEFSFIELNKFENNFPDNSIVHYSLDSLDGINIGDQSRGTFVARMFRNVKYFRDLEVYTHEFGHSFGMQHGFVNFTNPKVLFTLDGIMNNTYIASTSMYDPLDPLERYALQPFDGYIDQFVFADNYSQEIVDTYHFQNNCVEPDLSILEFELLNEDDDSHTFRIECANLGELNCGFVELSINVDNIDGSLIESRIIENMDINESIEIIVTIENYLLDGNSIYATLDIGEEIIEINESNNSKAFILTSINEPVVETALQVYPNPTNGVLYLDYDLFNHGLVSIFNLRGVLVYSAKYENHIDINHLESGIYYMRYQDFKTDIVKYRKILLSK